MSGMAKVLLCFLSSRKRAGLVADMLGVQFIVILCLLLSAVPCPAQQTGLEGDSLAVDSSEMRVEAQHRQSFEGIIDYASWGVGGYYTSDSVNQGSLFNFVFGHYIISDRLAIEFQYRMLRWVTIKSRMDEPVITSTPLVASCALAVAAWSGLAFRADERVIERNAALALLPFGPHLSYRMAGECRIILGLTPEFIMFSANDGILMQYRVGLRVPVDPKILLLELEVVKNHQFAWEGDSGDFGWGVGFYLSFGSGVGFGS